MREIMSRSDRPAFAVRLPSGRLGAAAAFAAALAATVAALLAPAAASAQVANPLPQSVGMGGNYVAVARGLGAPAWNPAGLGMPDNPAFSLALLPLAAAGGLDPITAGHFADFGGELIPRETRREWLDMIRAEGGESGDFTGDVTYLGLSVGRFALSASSTVRARVNVSPDVAEVFFFGNAGLTGEPGSYDLEGSAFDVAGTSTIAASTAIPVPLELGALPGQHFAVGVTLKYTVGNFLMLGRERRSTIEADPLDVQIAFPVVHTLLPDSAGDWDAGEALNNGSGFGLDVGAAWQGGIFSAGLVVRNLVNTFGWEMDDLQYRDGRATWNADTSYTSFQELDMAEAPQELVDRIDGVYAFSPVLAAGAAARVTPFLTVTGELRHALEETLQVAARSHIGVGAELTALPYLPIRAGISKITDGYQLSGGLGLRVGTVQLSGAAAFRGGDYGGDTVGAFGLTVGVR